MLKLRVITITYRGTDGRTDGPNRHIYKSFAFKNNIFLFKYKKNEYKPKREEKVLIFILTMEL